jgi:hypothetical protein
MNTLMALVAFKMPLILLDERFLREWRMTTSRGAALSLDRSVVGRLRAAQAGQCGQKHRLSNFGRNIG